MAELPKEKRKDAEKEKNTATLSKISNAIKGSEKLDVEGTDLLELLSHLEGELQARDVAIAALKSEQLKRVLYGCYTGKPRPHSPLAALQRDKNTVTDANRIEDEIRTATSASQNQIASLQYVVERQRIAAQKMANFLRESESQRSKLVLELEEERAKHERDTAQGDDITYELEKERIRLKQDLEAETLEKQKLEIALKEAAANAEEEKARQKQIVLLLLSDRKKLHKLYLEEKKRSEDLAQMLQEEKGKMETMAVGLEEESKRSLAMEAELEKHLSQFGSERQQFRDKLVADERRYRDLEEALRKARADVEHFKKQLSEAHRVAMSQAAPPPPYPGSSAVVTSQQQQQQPSSVSPTPLSALNRPVPPSQTSYANYTNYRCQMSNLNSTPLTTIASAPGVSEPMGPTYQGQQQQGGTVPRTLAAPVNSARLTSGNPVVRSVSGGFGIASHPALIPVGGNLSHLDPEVMATDTYSQVMKPGAGVAPKRFNLTTTGPTRKNVAATATGGDTGGVSTVTTSKPGMLGKGVPPPVPPNKPVVPAKKEIGKRTGGDGGKDVTLNVDSSAGGGVGKQQQQQTSSMVTGLQGLKFGISIGGGSDKGMKPLADSHSGPVTAVPGKKFYNNIESKS